jgi:hypothetical protein
MYITKLIPILLQNWNGRSLPTEIPHTETIEPLKSYLELLEVNKLLANALLMLLR